MNAKAAATGLASATIPGSIIVGVTLAVSAVAGLRAQRDHYAALAARPRPTATVTQVTSPPPRPTSPPAAATPQPRPSATPSFLTQKDQLERQRPRLLHLRQRAHLGEHLRRQHAVDLDQRNGIAARRRRQRRRSRPGLP